MLGAITTVKDWHTRKEFTEFFKQRSTKPTKEIGMPNFQFMSKMLTANPTKFSGTIRPMVTPGLVFAGTRKRSFTAAFNEYLVSGNQLSIVGGDAAGLSFSLRVLVSNLRNEMSKAGGDSAGTTGWLKMTNGQDGWVSAESDFVVQETGRYFYV